MKMRIVAVMALFLLMPAGGQAADRMIAGAGKGVDLVGTGAVDIVTSPGQIVNEVSQDLHNIGAGGVVTGIVSGTVLGAGQAIRGGGRMLIGMLDVLTAPIRESRYNRNSPGSLR